MKRLLFILGTFSLMMLALGFLFEVMEYEGAGILVLFGLVVITLVLVIAAIHMRNLLFYTSSLTMALLMLAWIFANLNLPGSDLFYMAGMLVLALVIIPLAGFWIYKHS